MTKFRMGAGVGLAAGFVIGTRVTRARRRSGQHNRAVAWLTRRSPTFDHAATAVGRARAVVDLSRERVHDARPVVLSQR